MKLQTVLWKEDEMYVIKEVVTGVTTQGPTVKEALTNLKEAVTLYIEEVPDTEHFIK